MRYGDESNGNYSEIGQDGVLRLHGGATVWQDMVMDISGRRLSSVSGTVDYDFDEVAISFSPDGDIADAGDRVCGNQQINHQFKVGAEVTFKPHIHWWQPVTTNAVGDVVFTLQWRLQRNSFVKATSWTAITAAAGTGDVWDHTAKADGDYNQITRFDNIVVACAISDTIQLRLTRTDSVSGAVLGYFFDLHGEIDSLGSEDEIVKMA